MKRTTHFVIAFSLFGFFGFDGRAGALDQAEVTRVINNVTLVDPATGNRPAVERDVIKEDRGLKTGARSRAELLFQDNTLARLGADTFFSFKPGTRDLNLRSGAMLLQVPKGLGGTKIRAAAVTAAITGTTILFENKPDSQKVIVLEGSLRLSSNETPGRGVDVRAGQMTVIPRGAKTIPGPVDIDLSALVKTSGLINAKEFKNKKDGEKEPVPSFGLIQKEIASQQNLLARHAFVPTQATSQNVGQSLEQRITAETADSASGGGETIIGDQTGAQPEVSKLSKKEQEEARKASKKGTEAAKKAAKKAAEAAKKAAKKKK